MLHRLKLPGILLLICSVTITVALYIQAKDSDFMWGARWLTVSSQLAALLGTLFLSFSFLLASKIKWLQKVFGGLDIMYKLHHLLGAFSFILLLYHPLLLMVQALQFPGAALSYISPFTSTAYLYGQLALVVMIILIILTLFIKMPYHLWKGTHQWMGLSLLFASLHIFLIQSDTARSPLLKLWMLSWIFIAVVSFFFVKFFYRFFGTRLRYAVSKIKSFEGITAITLQPKNAALHFQTGQFAFLQFADHAVGTESHPFSIVSPPDATELEFWSKDVGDYTQRLKLLKKGVPALVSGPYGNFMESVPRARHVICVAGGIGITPFMSLLQSETNSSATVVHSVKNQHEWTCQLVRQRLSDTAAVHYIAHESEQRGRLTAEMLTQYDPEWKTAHYYFCGPQQMMNSLRTQLLHLGIRPSKIFFEDFSLQS